jgi:hypothetical protein
LRVGISTEDAAPEVLLGCAPLCVRFSEFALTKAIVVALRLPGSTLQQPGPEQNRYIIQNVRSLNVAADEVPPATTEALKRAFG